VRHMMYINQTSIAPMKHGLDRFGKSAARR
jgi:hypothetical protein